MRCLLRISLLPPPCTLQSTRVPAARTAKTTKISLVGSILTYVLDLLFSKLNLKINLFPPNSFFKSRKAKESECQPFRDRRRTDRLNGLLVFRSYFLAAVCVFVRAAFRGADRRWVGAGVGERGGQSEGSIGNPGGGELLFWPPARGGGGGDSRANISD